MAKQNKPPQPPISDLQKELNELKVKRSIERTDIHDERIKNLESKINYFFYGIKC